MAADERKGHRKGLEALGAARGGGKTLKILEVAANNRKRVFEVRTRRQVFVFPFLKCDPAPSPEDRITNVYVDPELGREGFTYSLESGAEGSVHVDDVLEYNEDPSYMANLMLYQLTTEARKRFETLGLSAREVARRLDTSPAQLYRLLNPTNYSKSFAQMISLLYVLGLEVEVEVKEREVAG